MIGDAMCSGSQEVKIKRRLNTIFFRKGNSNVGNVNRGSVVDSEVPNHLSHMHFFLKIKIGNLRYISVYCNRKTPFQSC